MRLTKPRYIKVTLKDVDIELLDQTTARTHFTQVYRASNYNEQSRKSLLLKKIGHAWRIVDERNAPDPEGAASPVITSPSPSSLTMVEQPADTAIPPSAGH